MANSSLLYSEGYTEKCVMNNYFGIGLDAKIALDFHTRREEHPEKFRLAIARSFNLAGLSTHDKFLHTLNSCHVRV